MEMALISLPPISLSLRRPIAIAIRIRQPSVGIRIPTPTPTPSPPLPLSMQMHKTKTKTKTKRRRTHLLCTFNSNSHSLTSESDSESEKKNPPPIWSSFWTHLKPILKRLQAAAFAFFQHHQRHWQRQWQWQWQWPSRLRLAASLLTCAFLLLLLCTRALFRSSPALVPYSDLVSGIQLGRVSSVHFEEASRRIYFHTTSPSNSPNSHSQRFLTRKMDRDEKFLLALLRQHGVIYRSVPPPASRLLLSCIGTIAGLWIGVVPLIWILERRLHGNSSTNKNPSATTPTVSFHDVQGVDSAKQELIELVNCLRGTLDYKKLGAKLPTGILLVGPPGTGKTLLARALAAEAGVPFLSVSASEFVELYVGRGAARVRDLFKEARRQAPAVVFIDELDAVGTERDGFSAERDQTLNQLLTEMDGFDSDKQVIVLAATNRPAALDPALLRPGRFSRKVLVGDPDLEGRKRILAVHLKRVPLEEEMEVVCDLVASLTEGFVGADLANIANEAALLAVRRGGGLVTREDLMEAVEREKFGITENKANGVRGSKGLVKLLPWLPSLTQGSLKNKNRDRNAIGSRRVLSF